MLDEYEVDLESLEGLLAPFGPVSVPAPVVDVGGVEYVGGSPDLGVRNGVTGLLLPLPLPPRAA